jgi:hypothetical protein
VSYRIISRKASFSSPLDLQPFLNRRFAESDG